MGTLKKFMITLLLATLAFFCQFILGQSDWAYVIVGLFGGVMAALMFLEMIKTLKEGKYGVDLLAITAIVATLVVGEYWASLMILVMLTGGEALEEYASQQAGRELQSLLDHSPQVAHRLTSELVDVAVDELKVGEVVLVKPGEIIPVDGTIIEGKAIVDESSLTGEALLIDKQFGDGVMSGSLNGETSFQMVVTQKACDSQYQILVRLVEESQSQTAPFVRLADRYAVPFTLVAYMIAGIAWFVSKDPVRFAEVLVVASPCPLILAAPVAFVAGMSRLSRNGIIIKNGTTIEKLAKVKSVAFDKTGTLTKGELTVDQVFVTEALSREAFLTLVISSEQGSNHILARSLVAYGKLQQIPLRAVPEGKEIAGQGIEVQLEQGLLSIGRASFVKQGLPDGLSEQTAVFVALDNHYLGHITFKDCPRLEAQETLGRLQLAGVEERIMVTGDHLAPANRVAQALGIQVVHAQCLPQEKIRVIEKLPQTPGRC